MRKSDVVHTKRTQMPKSKPYLRNQSCITIIEMQINLPSLTIISNINYAVASILLSLSGCAPYPSLIANV